MAAILVMVLMACQTTPTVVDDIQRSHIEANVPPASDFNRLLQRDVETFFKGRHPAVSRVQFELLREGPTQSGVAYPKFYVWARAFKGETLLEQGAVRLAAVERKQFQITRFLSEADMRARPEEIYETFPAAVCERIKTRLGG